MHRFFSRFQILRVGSIIKSLIRSEVFNVKSWNFLRAFLSWMSIRQIKRYQKIFICRRYMTSRNLEIFQVNNRGNTYSRTIKFVYILLQLVYILLQIVYILLQLVYILLQLVYILLQLVYILLQLVYILLLKNIFPPRGVLEGRTHEYLLIDYCCRILKAFIHLAPEAIREPKARVKWMKGFNWDSVRNLN